MSSVTRVRNDVGRRMPETGNLEGSRTFYEKPLNEG